MIQTPMYILRYLNILGDIRRLIFLRTHDKSVSVYCQVEMTVANFLEFLSFCFGTASVVIFPDINYLKHRNDILYFNEILYFLTFFFYQAEF